jgi:hypothetical protein
VKSRRLSLLVAVVSCLSLFGAPTRAHEICGGIEAQVRLPAGETFVTSFQDLSTVTVPYVPATPYGYVGYRLENGMSFGLGLGFTYFKLDSTVPSQAVNNNGWALMVAPTLQMPFMRHDNYEFFAVARFVLGAGTQLQQIPRAPISTTIPFMTYGGNVGLGGTWYATSRFGIGAEAGAAINSYNATATTTVGGTAGAGHSVSALYVQTYFALTASYIF